MSLFYREHPRFHGKTSEKEDHYTARFVELVPRKGSCISFQTRSQEFVGEMIMEVTLTAKASATEVIVEFKDIPHGIRVEDNEAGQEASLEKLAAYVTGQKKSGLPSE
jgi:hypothetical protein